METYQVTEIKSYSVEVYGNNAQHRTVFKVAGNDQWLSAFVANPLTPGQSISGQIATTEKDGRTYHNFNFPRSGGYSAPAQAVGQSSTAQNPDKFTVSAAEVKNLIKLEIGAKLDRILALLDGLDPNNPSTKIDKAFDEAYPDDSAPFN